MNTYSRRLTVLLAIALSAACARPVRSGDSTPDKNRSLITRAELLANHFNNAYDAVSSLRSNWLQPRGTDSFHTPSQVWVYYDGVKLGGVESLSAIPVRPLNYIRHYNGVDATARWGVGHSAGVIYVATLPAGTSSTPH
jgi:hypothetical protein